VGAITATNSAIVASGSDNRVNHGTIVAANVDVSAVEDATFATSALILSNAVPYAESNLLGQRVWRRA
jgi:YbbR domain-containing protein